MAIGTSLMALAIAAAPPAFAQDALCKAPGSQGESSSSGGRQTAAQRAKSPDPLVRDMARADILRDEGRRDEAAAVYRRLASVPADRRQTARRANLRLAQTAMSAGDFGAAEDYVAAATRAGASADIQAGGRRLREMIAYRRGLAESEAALDQVEALVTSGRLDEAIAGTQVLLARPCPYPGDYKARVRTRLARVYRAKGDYDTARRIAVEAQASATTPNVRQGASQLIGEIETAARVAELRGTIERANALIAGGNAAGAIPLLEPIVAQPNLPAELHTTTRLRLARAYTETRRFDDAITVLEPLRAGAALTPEENDTVARIYLARANDLHERGDFARSEPAYRQLVDWTPSATPEVRDSARLGLARALANRGDEAGALEQIALVQQGAATPRLVERANNLIADLQNGVPFNRLVGYVEAGIAYDTNAPTLVSAIREDDDDVNFPNNQRFDDLHASVAGRLQYRAQLGDSGNSFDLIATGLRTFQFDLPELDRTRLALQAGPTLALSPSTDLMLGGQFEIEWRGDSFRASEPGAYIGVRHELSNRATASAIYRLEWHNDYRDERDGVDHNLDTQFRYEVSDADVLTLTFRAEREGAEVERFRNWGLLGGLAFRHRWQSERRMAPFVEASAEAERVSFDGILPTGGKRRDWKVRLETAAGLDIDRKWRARLHYAFFDISSNVPARNRLADHQVGLSLRYMWN